MKNPAVSVVVPAYNIEQYLPRCLDSLLVQTLTDLEVIVVDDGSSDGTSAIAEQYAGRDPRVRLIRKENGGVTSARLAGARAAAGEYIGFCDGDDWTEPDMFERLLKNAQENDADISHCGYQMVFPHGQVDYYYNTGIYDVQNRLTALGELLSGRRFEPGLWNKLFRKELLKSFLDSNTMPADIRINEDLLMNYYLFKAAERSVYEDFCPYHYILRAGSAATSRLNQHQLWNPLRVAELIEADAPTEVRVQAKQKMWRLLITGASMCVDNQAELILPYRAHARKELRRRLPEILQERQAGSKLKLMALVAAICPAGYGWAHRMYARATKLDKKYDMETR